MVHRGKVFVRISFSQLRMSAVVEGADNTYAALVEL
jgi:hypothetical protein